MKKPVSTRRSTWGEAFKFETKSCAFIWFYWSFDRWGWPSAGLYFHVTSFVPQPASQCNLYLTRLLRAPFFWDQICWGNWRWKDCKFAGDTSPPGGQSCSYSLRKLWEVSGAFSVILAASGGFSAQLLLLLRSKKEKVVSLVPDSSWISGEYKGEIFSTGVGLRCRHWSNRSYEPNLEPRCCPALPVCNGGSQL